MSAKDEIIYHIKRTGRQFPQIHDLLSRGDKEEIGRILRSCGLGSTKINSLLSNFFPAPVIVKPVPPPLSPKYYPNNKLKPNIYCLAFSNGITGGHKTIYQTVNIFKKRGFNSALVLGKFYPQYVPTFSCFPKDIITYEELKERISPEEDQKNNIIICFLNDLTPATFELNAKRYFLSLVNNHYYGKIETDPKLYNILKIQDKLFGENAYCTTSQYKWDGLIANNEFLYNKFIEDNSKTKVCLCPHCIDKGVFKPSTKEPNSVGYICRPNRDDEKLINKIKDRFPDKKYYHLKNLSEYKFADKLSHLEFFLVTSKGLGPTQDLYTKKVVPSSESWGLPGFEAMASGCVVIGFPAIGGNMYMTKNNCYKVDDYDDEMFIDCVGKAFISDQENKNKIIKEGMKTISEFTEERSFQALKKMMEI